MSDSAELMHLRDELNPVVQDLSARIDKELVIAPPEGSASSHHSDESPTTSQSFHSKLKLQLPHFSGDLLQWKDFWDLFSAVIEKICHLQASMKSEDAKTVVRHAAAKGTTMRS